MKQFPFRRRRLLRWLSGSALGAGGLVVGRDEWLSAGPGWRGAPSDHFNGRTFFNPWNRVHKTSADAWKWRFTRKPVPWPDHADGMEQPRPVKGPEAAATFIGHATWLLQLGGINILTDPVWSPRCSPVSWAGPKRVRPPALALGDLPPVHLIVLSHNHYDHLDLWTLRELQRRWGPAIVTGLGNRGFLASKGIGGAVELDWWQQCTAAGADLTFTPAQHWSNRGGHGLNATLWGGFHIRAGGRSVYFAGDTGYAPFFTEIRDRCGAPHLALLPIGAYEPRWFMAAMHMNPAEAVQAHRELNAQQSLGMHFGTWQLTDEGIDDPSRDLASALAAGNLDSKTFQPGAFGRTITLPA